MRKFILILIAGIISLTLSAGEGMWLPLLLGQLNEKEMKSMGMRISAEDIYSVNHSSLKDAVVLFGGGCTAEVVSEQGLLLTNHHCGFSNIQRHSTLEHDYLTEGFWAGSLSEELPNPGLSVTFLISMEEVTDKILAGLHPGMRNSERDALVQKNAGKLENEAVKGTHYKASVKPFYNGNQYYLFILETFTDIRLVGAPPSNIGKFGGDTDNWMWPRHTGDFSVFRIYASKENLPAEYSVENVPYRPRKSLSISIKGVQEGDFTFVYGFPGSTQEYLPSSAVDLAVNLRNPIAIQLRAERLSIIDQAMENDRLTRIQYSAKSAGIANFWKKMIGESRGIKLADGIEKKEAFEAEFNQWVKAEPNRAEAYGGILPEFKSSIEQFRPYHKAYTGLTEGPLTIELIRYAYGFNQLVKQCTDGTISDEDISKTVQKLQAGIEGYFKNYSPSVDRKIFAAMMRLYMENSNPEFIPFAVGEAAMRFDGDYPSWAGEVYDKSMFSNQDRISAFLNSFRRKDCRKIQKDPAFQLAQSLYSTLQTKISPVVSQFYVKADSLQRLYMKAQMEMQPNKTFYPDANSTLRVAYGKVKGYSPSDAVDYRWYTTLEGIMEKENPDIYDYVVEPKLKQLSDSKDFSKYADVDGSMHVAFIASNHTTGGNSGSPVLDADGRLVGINFDRCWEGTMSDLMFDADQCRNIALDIRYCLFVIEKLAGANRLIEEMNIVSN